MNKTLRANVAGVVFNIEEDAYNKLKDYLDGIRRNFKDSGDQKEIIDDIEARIAELFQEKAKGPDQVVTLDIVEEVIEMLGQPRDYDADEEQEKETEDRTEQEETATRKRVFRDPDDRFIGGVCAGISAYLGWDPMWLRLAFVIALLIGGVGPLIYLVLWIVMPIAKTRAEKLQMRGEPVNLDNLKKKVKEETERVKEGVDRMAEETRRFDSEKVKTRARNGVDRIGDFLLELLRLLGRTLIKLVGFSLILVGIALAIALLTLLLGGNISLIFMHGSGAELDPLGQVLHCFTAPSSYPLFFTGLLLVLGIPVIGLFYAGIRLLFDIRQGSGKAGLILFILWLIGIGVLTMALLHGFDMNCLDRIGVNGAHPAFPRPV